MCTARANFYRITCQEAARQSLASIFGQRPLFPAPKLTHDALIEVLCDALLKTLFKPWHDALLKTLLNLWMG